MIVTQVPQNTVRQAELQSAWLTPNRASASQPRVLWILSAAGGAANSCAGDPAQVERRRSGPNAGLQTPWPSEIGQLQRREGFPRKRKRSCESHLAVTTCATNNLRTRVRGRHHTTACSVYDLTWWQGKLTPHNLHSTPPALNSLVHEGATRPFPLVPPQVWGQG